MSKMSMQRVCRLCCSIKCRMRPLFEQRQEYPLSLYQIVYALADLKISPDDGLPQKICSHCATNLVKMYKTIQSYRENDTKLRRQFKPGVNKNIMEVEEIILKQEVIDDDCQESQSSNSKPNSDNDDKQQEDLVDPDKEDSTVMGIRIKNEPLDEPDDDPSANEEDTDTEFVDSNDRPDNNSVPKPKRGRPKTAVRDPNQPKLHDYKCYICKSESHDSALALLTHLNDCHKDLLPFTCTECVMEKVVLSSLLSLNKHLRQHLNPEKCPYCDKRYLNKYKVSIHIQNQHSALEDGKSQCPMKCEQCNEEYPSKVLLMQHVKTVHTASILVGCAACGEEFDNRNKLRAHIQRQHSQVGEKFPCTICQKELSTLKILQNHLKTFHTNKASHEFKCDFCHKTYSTLHSKRAHEKRHIRDPNYKAKQNWTQYYTPLEGENGLKKKKCKCLLCGKITKKITVHLQTIHFPAKFDCEFCGKVYKNKHKFERHLSTHAHGQGHQCSICQATFVNRKKLFYHKRTKHPKPSNDRRDGQQLPKQERGGLQLPQQEQEGLQLPQQERDGLQLPQQEQEGLQLPMHAPDESPLLKKEPDESLLPKQQRDGLQLTKQERDDNGPELVNCKIEPDAEFY